ncbi:hypothetical protein [Pseudomonas aeruginosa]|uniref:hypothetical protein n=1 Tax=Pseudomonas aeruginosa TaxID=287 RepID=UPI0021633573|nr:hypothetical protein [Pseudomonas aeruginosa]
MIYEDGKVTVAQVMDDVLAAGYAEKTIKRGVISAARDEPRTTFGHMYSPQNMDGPLRISISAPSEDDYDGVDVEFVNANGWIEDTGPVPTARRCWQEGREDHGCRCHKPRSRLALRDAPPDGSAIPEN